MGVRPVSPLEIWRNPILVRYLRSRLRAKGLLLRAIPTMILVSFVGLIAYYGGSNYHRGQLFLEESMRQQELPASSGGEPSEEQGRDRVEAATDLSGEARRVGARTAFLAIFVVQCCLLMLWGTFSVAVGVSREAIEGILEYQRLTPMSPLAKIVGYVLGLPIRETVLCLMTLPFTVFTVQVGEIPSHLVWKLYLVMATSSLMYHMTGFLAGIVVKNRFMSGLLSQLMMIVLYLLLPQLSRLGYVIFLYLTVRPVFMESLGVLFEQREGDQMEVSGSEPFFQVEVPLLWFTLLMQGFLFSVFLLVVYRRIRSQEEHLLGKFSAIPVFGGFVTILLGTILPGIPNESIFPSMAGSALLGDRMGGFRPVQPFEGEMLAIPGAFGFGMIVILLLVVFLVTPTEDTRIKGLRLARKRGRHAAGFWADASSSLPTTLICTVVAVVAWLVFLTALLRSEHYEGWEFAGSGWIFFPLSILVPVLFCQLILESSGRTACFMILLFTWVVPPMAGMVLGLASLEGSDIVIYVISLSGFSLPINAMRGGLEGVAVTPALGAFQFSLVLHAIAVTALGGWAFFKHRSLRRKTLQSG